MVDISPLLISLSGLSVVQTGFDIAVSGITIKNIGTSVAENFRVGITYVRADGNRYKGYVNINRLVQGAKTNVSYTFSGAGFVPSSGDYLKIEADPERSMPEINLNDNTATRQYPFIL